LTCPCPGFPTWSLPRKAGACPIRLASAFGPAAAPISSSRVRTAAGAPVRRYAASAPSRPRAGAASHSSRVPVLGSVIVPRRCSRGGRRSRPCTAGGLGPPAGETETGPGLAELATLATHSRRSATWQVARGSRLRLPELTVQIGEGRRWQPDGWKCGWWLGRQDRLC